MLSMKGNALFSSVFNDEKGNTILMVMAISLVLLLALAPLTIKYASRLVVVKTKEAQTFKRNLKDELKGLLSVQASCEVSFGGQSFALLTGTGQAAYVASKLVRSVTVDQLIRVKGEIDNAVNKEGTESTLAHLKDVTAFEKGSTYYRAFTVDSFRIHSPQQNPNPLPAGEFVTQATFQADLILTQPSLLRFTTLQFPIIIKIDNSGQIISCDVNKVY